MAGYAPIPVQPVLYTWTGNEIIPVPYLRASVSAAAQLLSAPPCFLGYQQSTAQSIASDTFTGVDIDTEAWDSVNGHDAAASPNRYWNQFAGYYLAEFSCGIDYNGGAGIAAAGIGFAPAGGAVTFYGGGCIPNSGNAGQETTPNVAKLLLCNSPGAIGGGAVDQVLPSFYQSSGSAQNTWYDTAAGQYPQFQVTWVGSPTGTALPLPANPAWPVPPGYITSAFMNANVSEAIGFLIYPPLMEAVYAAGTATCPSVNTLPTVGTTVPLDTATYDTWSAFDTSTHTWTAPVAGIYYCYGQTAYTGDSTSSDMASGLTVTSSNYNGGTQTTLWQGVTTMRASGTSNVTTVRRRLRLNAGDTILLAAAQHDTGGNAATLQAGEFASRLITIWRSA